MQAPEAETPSRLEIILAIAGAVVCLVVTIIIWVEVSAQQPMWPLPGAYFTEFMLISAVIAYLWVSNHPLRITATWAAAEVFSVLVFIGLFSIGLFYIPNVLIFGSAGNPGGCSGKAEGRNSPGHLPGSRDRTGGFYVRGGVILCYNRQNLRQMMKLYSAVVNNNNANNNASFEDVGRCLSG